MRTSLCFLLLLISQCVAAQPAGTLDPSFGNGGQVVLNLSNGQDQGRAVALQPDGKLLVAGFLTSPITGKDFSLVRLNADGSLDSTFGTAGTVSTDVQLGSEDIAYAIALQLDGKILLAGSSDDGTDRDAAVLRYNSDGGLDTSFGNAGKVLTDFDGGMQDEVKALRIHLLTGNIIVGGAAIESSSLSKPVVARYLPDGRLDSTFNATGIRTLLIGSNPAQYLYAIEDLAVQSNGKISAVGWRDFTGLSYDSDYWVCRINSDGSSDNTFSGDGANVYNGAFNGHDRAFSMILRPNNNIYMAGGGFLSTLAYDMTAFELNSDGSIGSWAAGANYGNLLDDICYALVEDNQGRFVFGGTSGSGNNSTFAIARVNSDGSSDGTFGTSGKVTTTFGGNSQNECFDMLVQSDDKIVAVGGTGNDLVVARYLGEGLPQWDAFQLQSPANQSTGLSYTQRNFNWTDAYLASFYQMELDTVATFTANPQTYNVTISAHILYNLLPAQTYYWRVRAGDGNNWGNYSAVWSFTTEEVLIGNAPVLEVEILSVYPNPAKEMVWIELAAKSVGKSYSISDAAGRVVLQGELRSQVNAVSLEDLPRGLYFLRLGEGKVMKLLRE